MSATVTSIGPNLRAVLRSIEGTKRRRVAAALAVHLDAGITDPSIAQLTERARLPRVAVVRILEGLEAEGAIRVLERGDFESTRSTYALTGAPAPTDTQTKENEPMSTDTATTPILPPEGERHKILWATKTWLKPLHELPWTAYREGRDRHLELVDALKEAQGTPEEAPAIRMLITHVSATSVRLRQRLAEAAEIYERERQKYISAPTRPVSGLPLDESLAAGRDAGSPADFDPALDEERRQAMKRLKEDYYTLGNLHLSEVLRPKHLDAVSALVSEREAQG